MLLAQLPIGISAGSQSPLENLYVLVKADATSATQTQQQLCMHTHKGETNVYLGIFEPEKKKRGGVIQLVVGIYRRVVNVLRRSVTRAAAGGA